jgi:uncharacterized RDD family membrane protein YckC
MSRDRPVEVLEGRTAGFVTRMLAYLLDVLVLTAILAMGSWLAVQTDNLMTEVLPEDIQLGISATTLFALLTPFIIIFYYVMFWSLSGRTIGKWVLGVRVVQADGLPPTIGRSLLRMIGYVVSLIVFFLGFLWILIDDQRKGWHDHMAKTWVVYDWARRRPGQIYEDMKARDHSSAEGRG